MQIKIKVITDDKLNYVETKQTKKKKKRGVF